MNLLKPTLLAALVAAPAAAETWTLSTHQHWSVQFYEYDGNRGCSAKVDAGDAAFWISYDENGLDVNIASDEWKFGQYGTGDMAVWVDDFVQWDVTNANAMFDMVWFDLTAPDFIKEISRGHRVYADIDLDGKWDIWFSLAGSSAALVDLDDCVNKLDSEGL